MIRLGTWGEGYVTSLKGAQIIQQKILEHGIKRNIDKEFEKYSRFVPNVPWKLMVESNEGHIKETDYLPNLFAQSRKN